MPTHQEALELLKDAKRPIIIAGNGAIRKLASSHLRQFVQKTNIPVVATFMGKGAVSDKDKHSLFSIGVRGQDFSTCAIDAADLIMTVGYDIAEYAPEAWNKNLDRPIVHIDFETAEVYEHYQPAVEIVADISATLWELNQAQLSQFSNWFMPARKGIEKDRAEFAEDSSENVTIPWVLAQVRKNMADEDIIISDVGSHKMWIGRNFPVYTPGTCIISNGFATMGIAVPGGIGAKLARPERKVVTISGDGGFLMNAQEIETAKRIGTPFTIIVLNDNDYGLISWKQKAHAGHSFGTVLSNPDFKKYGESFGIKSFYAKTKGEVESALAAAIDANELALVGIDIDARANLKLTEKLNSNLCQNFNLQT